MTVLLATIASIFFLMPGFAFIAGVNLIDKNVREIVFRGTPAETAYVVAISLIVHFLFSQQPFSFVNPAILLTRYVDWDIESRKLVSPTSSSLPAVLSAALRYFVVSSLAGGAIGYGLGKAILQRQIGFFIKHRWMLILIGGAAPSVFFARALTKANYTMPGKEGELAVVVEGSVRDCYFASDGTLLYLVFTSYQAMVVDLLGKPLPDIGAGKIGGLINAFSHASADGKEGRLVLEGSQISMVHYARQEVGRIVSTSGRESISKRVDEDPDAQPSSL